MNAGSPQNQSLALAFQKRLCGFVSRFFDSAKKRRLNTQARETTEVTLDGIKLDVSKLSITLRECLLENYYENAERALCRKHLVQGDRVLEVGSAIGAVALVCQKEVGITDYICVEANPETIQVLESNHKLNGFKPRVIHAALAPSAGEVSFTISSFFPTDSLLSRKGGGDLRVITVPAKTLHGLFEECPFQPNVLIMDIEGAEQFIDFTALPPSVEKIIIETHPGMIGWPATWNVIGSLISFGFKAVAQEHESVLLMRDPGPR